MGRLLPRRQHLSRCCGPCASDWHARIGAGHLARSMNATAYTSIAPDQCAARLKANAEHYVRPLASLPADGSCRW